MRLNSRVGVQRLEMKGKTAMVEKLEKELDDDSAESGRQDEEHGGGRDKPFEVSIRYSGPDRTIEVSKDEAIESVTAKAIAIFSITSNQHVLALYTEAGTELLFGETVKSTKIKKRDVLLLRPSAVRAG
jgi:hypothetical protein